MRNNATLTFLATFARPEGRGVIGLLARDTRDADRRRLLDCVRDGLIRLDTNIDSHLGSKGTAATVGYLTDAGRAMLGDFQPPPPERTNGEAEMAGLRLFAGGATVGVDRAMFVRLQGRALVFCPTLSPGDDTPVYLTQAGRDALGEG